MCVHADGNYSDVFTCSGKPRKLTFKLHQFDEWFATLQHNTFVRVGRSFIVNKSYVQAINLTENRIILAGGNLKEPMVYGGFSRESLRQLKNELERKEEKTND